MNERGIFMEAMEKDTLAQRSAYLDEACAGDAALRQRVEALLASHEQAGSFLGKSVPERLADKFATPQGPGETRGESAGQNGGEALDFLSPSEKPGSIGRLGHYEILEVVGRGGMGVVLRAFDDKLQRVVAVKVMAPQLAANASARKRFIREAQAIAAIRDEHVIAIHAVEEVNGLPYLAMEYVAGVSLQERLDRSGPLELKEILRIGLQTAAGLAAAHAQGLIHRDVKPSNILLENGAQCVRITDFGLARAVDDASLTQNGAIAGTPQYMAPEQARGEAVDQRADLFSLGSVLYAMCVGHPPFCASGSMAVLKRVCEDMPRSLRDISPETPDWLAALIAKLLAKDPPQRFQSAAEVGELLSQHLAHLQQPSIVPMPLAAKSAAAPPAPVKIRRHRWPFAAGVLLLVAGGLGLTEATAVTQVVPTLIRIFTPEGTLVVEVDDPAIKVTLEGDGGLVISGAGWQELRLQPGSYRLQASKDGHPVHSEIVTVSRGGKQVVKVRREEATAATKPLSREARLEQARQQLEEADRLYKLGEPLRGPDPWQAELHFRKAVAIYERLGQDFPESPASKQKLAACRWCLGSALNMQAHVLVHSRPMISATQAQRAVALVKEANALVPPDQGFWSTLALAHYRAKDWDAAQRALEKTEHSPLAPKDFHTGYSRFVLALIHWQRGEKERARRCYDQAAEWMGKHRPTDAQLLRIRAEASELLGVPKSP